MRDVARPQPSEQEHLCQRWWRRRARYLTATGGSRFDPRRYRVQSIPESVARSYVIAHHYSGTYPATSQRFGMFLGDHLVGVAVYGIPASPKVLTNAFPDLEPYSESLELSRFVLTSGYDRDGQPLAPANAESWLIAQCHRRLLEQGVRGVVAFSDPVPRSAGPNGVILPGHVGIIYQASNAVYTGRSTARTLTVLPNGRIFSARARSKIVGGDRGWRYAVGQLVDAGARCPVPGARCPAGETLENWLPLALAAIGARTLRHPGNHRYCFPLARNSRLRRQIAVGHPSCSFPKPVPPARPGAAADRTGGAGDPDG